MSEVTTAEFSAQLEIRDEGDGDGRTVFGRLVPFDVVTESAGLTSAGASRRYREVFKRGAFAKTITENRERVVIRPSHGAPPVGKFTKLEEREDGLYGEAVVSRTVAGDEMLTLIRDGVTPDLSIEFLPIRGKNAGGVTERHEVALRGVAATYRPAYAGAEVLAIREDGSADPDAAPKLAAAQRVLTRLKATPR